MAKMKKRNIERSRKDFHHFLYQGKFWKTGYAKRLRDHWYMGAYIPSQTLHKIIHSKIHDIPVPNGRDCKRAYLKLIELERFGLIKPSDTAEIRLNFLIMCWKDTCPATVAVLEWQKQVISKFYDGSL